MRHGADALLFAFDDSLRRRSLHTGEKSYDGVVAFDSHAISGRLAFAGALPGFGGRMAAGATRTGKGWSLLHQYARRAPAGAENPAASEERHEADCDDH